MAEKPHTSEDLSAESEYSSHLILSDADSDDSPAEPVELITISDECDSAEEMEPESLRDPENEVVLDITGSLLEDYPSDIEETAASRDNLPRKSGMTNWLPVMRDDSPQDCRYAPEPEWPSLGSTDNQRSRKIAAILSKEKHIEFRRFEKVPQAPRVLGKSISHISRFTSLARRNMNQMLSHFAFCWSDEQKNEFVKSADGMERFCGPAKLINHLKIEDYQLELIISVTHDITIEILKREPDNAATLLEMIASLYGQPTKEKLDKFKPNPLYSPARARHFLTATDDANLLGLANVISRTFMLERPVGLRREWYHRAIAEVHRKVDDGVMSFEAAVAKVGKLMDVAGEHHLALSILEPYERFHAFFAHEWLQQGAPPPFPAPLACPMDEFHHAPIDCIRVLTFDMAAQVVEKIQREQHLYIVLRTLNDYRYDQNALGMVGFTAAHWEEAYFLFPFTFPLISAAVASFAKKKQLHCVNVRRAQFMIGLDCKFSEIAQAHPAGRKRGSDQSPIASILRSKGVSHCNNHFYDMFVHPMEVHDNALRHAAAELYFLANAK